MIVKKAHQLGIKSITTSLLDYYKHVEQRALKRRIEFRFLKPNKHSDQQEMIETVQRIRNVTDAYQVGVKSCCEKYPHSKGFTKQGSWVDGNYLNKLFGPAPLINLTPDKEKNSDADAHEPLTLAGIPKAVNGLTIAVTIVPNVMQENNVQLPPEYWVFFTQSFKRGSLSQTPI